MSDQVIEKGEASSVANPACNIEKFVQSLNSTCDYG